MRMQRAGDALCPVCLRPGARRTLLKGHAGLAPGLCLVVGGPRHAAEGPPCSTL